MVLPPHAGERSWESQRADAGSMLHLYRKLLAARRASPALRAGDFEWLAASEGALAWRRRDADDGDRGATVAGTGARFRQRSQQAQAGEPADTGADAGAT